MPKIEEEFEEDEEDEEDELESEPEPRPIKAIRKGKTKIKKKVPAEPKRRFGVVPPQPVRLVDTESNEVLGEGDYLVTTALADILERLERIENSIGSMLEG